MLIILALLLALLSLLVAYFLSRAKAKPQEALPLNLTHQQEVQKIQTEKDLISKERNELNIILSSVTLGIIALDFNKNVVLVNQAAQQMTGFRQDELAGRPIDQFIHFFTDSEEVLPKTFCRDSFSQVLNLVGREGRKSKVNLSTAPLAQDIATNLGYILILQDLSKEEELERMKLDFVSMASHELKTPLTSIVGYLSVFLDENRQKLTQEQIDLLDRSLVSARQLLTLVGNLLNVNKIERDQLAITPQALDYQSILNKAVADLENQAKLKNITLTLHPQASPLPKVLADPIRIVEVLDNLISNAINYTNPGGSVAVTLVVNPNEVVTTVSDTGIGIPKEAIPHLFNKFFRVSGQTQQGSKGTGLGLFISKSIIEKHNGKIWAQSEGLGQGSKFHFSLPTASTISALEGDTVTREAIKGGALNY